MTSKTPGKITFEQDGAIARIGIDNPDRRNAMSMSMWLALAEAMQEIDQTPDCRVVILRGTGDKAFVSGADISEFATQRSSANGVSSYGEAVSLAQNRLAESSVPVIANIHGICMGGGLGLAMSCDLRYCADQTRFRMPAARLGLGYGFSGMQQLVGVVGAARAADIFYTARIFEGTEAEKIALVHQSLPANELDAHVEQVAGNIAGNAPLTIKAAKLAIRSAVADPAQRDLAAIDAAVKACFKSQDYKEGQEAFMAKRPPQFFGK